MKKLKLGIGLAALVMSSSIFADTIYVNYKQIDVESQRVDDLNYVPIRFVAEELGAIVEWQKPNVIIKKDEMMMRLTIDSHTVNVNGQDFSIEGMPYLSNNTTYVPLRVVSEQLNCRVVYEANVYNPSNRNCVYITSKDKALTTPAASLADTKKVK